MISGIDSKKYSQLRDDARRLISEYDVNRDGRVDRGESQRSTGRYSNTYTSRINDTYVRRTVVESDNFRGIRDFELADLNGDGQLSEDELTDSYLNDCDHNKDGKIGWWEGIQMGFGNLRGRFERSWSVEVSRRSYTEYSPDYNWDRPRPPSVNPDPWSPDPRPRPPSIDPDPRPRPPSIDPVDNGDRPRPPSI